MRMLGEWLNSDTLDIAINVAKYAASALAYYERQSIPQAEGVHRFLADE